jgi:hypothetical protein
VPTTLVVATLNVRGLSANTGLALEVVLGQQGRTKPNILILTETKLMPQAQG